MLSIVIPFHYDSVNRVENLLLVLDHIKSGIKFDQIVISEMDSVSRIGGLLPDYCDYVFARDGSGVWSRSKRINLGFSLVRGDILMVMDSDVLLDPQCVNDGIYSILLDKFDIVFPFGEVHHFAREGIIKQMKVGLNVPDYCSSHSASRVFSTNGISFLTRSSTFKHIRGMNENFLGWGLEDDELLARYQKLGFRCGKNKVPVIHINHARTANCVPQGELIKNSLKEKHRIFSLSKDDLLDYFGITGQPGGYTTGSKGELSSSVLSKVEEEYFKIMNVAKSSYEI